MVTGLDNASIFLLYHCVRIFEWKLNTYSLFPFTYQLLPACILASEKSKDTDIIIVHASLIEKRVRRRSARLRHGSERHINLLNFELNFAIVCDVAKPSLHSLSGSVFC